MGDTDNVFMKGEQFSTVSRRVPVFKWFYKAGSVPDTARARTYQLVQRGRSVHHAKCEKLVLPSWSRNPSSTKDDFYLMTKTFSFRGGTVWITEWSQYVAGNNTSCALRGFVALWTPMCGHHRPFLLLCSQTNQSWLTLTRAYVWRRGHPYDRDR